MFLLLSSWPKSHCESLPSSFDECRLSAGWPPTLRPSQSTWAVNPPKIGSYRPHPQSPLLLLVSPWADTDFSIPRRAERWVDLGTVVEVCSPCPRLYIAVAVAINTTVCGVNRTWVLSKPQSDTLTSRPCDLQCLSVCSHGLVTLGPESIMSLNFSDVWSCWVLHTASFQSIRWCYLSFN